MNWLSNNMSDPGLPDHLYALVVFVLFSIYARVSFPREIEHIRARGEPARVSAYRQVIAIWILFAVVMLAIWWFAGRDWQALGMGRPEWGRGLIGLVVAAAVIAVIVLPIRSISRSENGPEILGNQLGDLALFMPRTRRESSWFRAVSINAGITEELIFRGYLMWYLTAYLDIWWAAIIAIFAFGLAHAYQGLRQFPGVLFVSAIAVGLFVYTRNLLVPILFHIALDVFQGHYFARAHPGGETCREE